MQNIEKLTDNIPDHLREFVVEQDQTHYQPIDHAVWRYILRQLKNYLGRNAHESYLDGLKKTGITVDSIPSIDGICQKLQEFGWSAVPVSGFIPPAAFMELQSLSILPIATDMRSIDHLLYTPAPDIVHEAAGHAPMLINPEFAKYLKEYAQVAKRAIVSHEDLALYEAIRDLSDIKEHPDSTQSEIDQANRHLESVVRNLSVTSEATLLGRMNWWTAEYGLIGNIENPKIYGAGLLSSFGESRTCLKPQVRKIPLSVSCVDFSYDITEKQPQLFVAPSFSYLTEVLHELANGLSFKKGGVFGLARAKEAQTVNTIQLNSGIQVSGLLADYLEKDGQCFYFRTEGPTQLCMGGHELKGHDKNYHSHGFSSPIGKIKGFSECLSWASSEDLEKKGLVVGQFIDLEFESGVRVKGKLTGLTRTQRRELCLMTLQEAWVHYGDRVLFDPAWGVFDMAVGSSITSVFAGPADRKSYGLTDSFAKKKVPPRKLTERDQRLNHFYQEIRNLRGTGQSKAPDLDHLRSLWKGLEREFPGEWLPQLELLEISLVSKAEPQLQKSLQESLLSLKGQLDEEKASLIDDGLQIAHLSL